MFHKPGLTSLKPKPAFFLFLVDYKILFVTLMGMGLVYGV